MEQVNEAAVEAFLTGAADASIAQLQTVISRMERFARPGGERPVLAGQKIDAATVAEAIRRLRAEIAARERVAS